MINKNKFSKAILILLLTLMTVSLLITGSSVLYRKMRIEEKYIDQEPYSQTVNSRNFRVVNQNEEYEKEQDKDLRIICLGDSLTWGHGVADDETYPYYLQKLLNENSGKSVEVINAGISGSCIIEQLKMYENKCLDLKHDYVILLYSGSDEEDYIIQTLFLEKDWQMVDAGPTIKNEKIKDLGIVKFAKYRVLQKRHENIRNSIDEVRKSQKGIEMMENMKQDYLRLQQMAGKNGAELVLAFYNAEDNDIILRFCMEKNIPMIDARQYWQGYDKKDLHIVVHHNAKGNLLLAEMIGEKFSEKYLSD